MREFDNSTHKKESRRIEKHAKSGTNKIKEIDAVKGILDALPEVILLLDGKRRIVYCNNYYFEASGKPSTQSIIGLKPGELLECIQTEGGVECGSTKSCKVCGLVNSVIDAQKEQEKIIRNVKITVRNEKGKSINIDFGITASPFYLKNKYYTLVTIRDISRERRIKSLERIFLHDLYDKVSSLKFLLETIYDKTAPSRDSEKLKHSKYLSAEIVEEIESYRSILAAEKGDLEIENEKLNSYDIIWNVVNNISYHTVAHGKSIEVIEETERLIFETDAKILGRILANMLKNALEETPGGGSVKISCEKQGEKLIFWVHNKTAMSNEAKEHIFERQFSSKGIHRGLGTYSMRLLGEEYLGGDVYFNSSDKKGTTFYLSLPAFNHKSQN